MAANVAVTEPGDVPDVGETLSQLESLTVAVHDPPLHPLGDAVTVKAADPPEEGRVVDDAVLEEKVQVGVMPASVKL